MADDKIIYELLKEVREDQKEHGKELSKQSAYLVSMDNDVKELKQTVARNTEDIAHHIRRTDILQDLHVDNRERLEQAEKRLEKLEEPVKAKAWVRKHLVSLISFITALGSLIALFLNQK